MWHCRLQIMHADWSSFGSWWEFSCPAGFPGRSANEAALLDPGHAIPPDVIRCFWDGRDHHLMIETSPSRPLSAPNEWRKEHAKGFDTSDEAVHYLQDYLKRRFQHDSPEKT